MSDRTKGNSYEKRAQHYLESMGYLVDRAHQSVVWIPRANGTRFPVSKHVDFFGAFDLIALRSDRPVRLVQVTTSRSRAAKRAKVQEALRSRLPDLFYQAEVWAWGRTDERGWGFTIDRLGRREWETDSSFVSSKKAPLPHGAAIEPSGC